MSTPGLFRQRLRKLSSVFALIGGGLAIAFLIWALGDSERRIASVDQRNVADLAILVDGLEQWPRAAASIGNTNVFEGGDRAGLRVTEAGIVKTLYHPDFDSFEIRYTAGPPPCPAVRSIVEGDGPGTTASLIVAGTARAAPPGAEVLPELAAGGGPYCYSMRLPLDAMLRVSEVGPGFSHLLIANPDGRIVAQIGNEALPIRSLSDLPKLQPALREFASTLDPSLNKLREAMARDALEPIDTRIAGTAYRLYQRPFRLGPGLAATVSAPREAGAPAGAAPTANAAAVDPNAGYVAIAVAPRESVNNEVRRVSLAALTAFVLSFALLLALMPALKLRLLGPVDDLAPLEAGAVVLGIAVAAWVATVFVGYSILLLDGREQANERARRTAAWIARDVGAELDAILAGRTRTSDLLARMARTLGEADTSNVRRLAYSIPTGSDGYQVDYPQPDGLFMANGRGEQVTDTPVVSLRDGAGAFSNVRDRGYFRRALKGELVEGPGSTPAPLNCVSPRYAMDQVRSLPDGIAKTVLAFPVRGQCCPPGITEGCIGPRPEAGGDPSDRPAVLVVAMVLRSLLAPLLSSDVEFMVVDLDDQRLRALFHSVRPRAQVESLADGIGGRAVSDAFARLRAQSPSACGSPAAPSPVSFAAKYDGRTRSFAATRIPCTGWAVLAHVDREATDSRAAEATLWAIRIFMSQALTVGLVLLLAWLYARRRSWVWPWPDPRQTGRYAALATVVSAFGAVSIGWLLLGWWLEAPPLLTYLVPAFFAPVTAWTATWIFLGRSDSAKEVRRKLRVNTAPGRDRRLSPATERAYRRLVAGLLLVAAAIPAAAQLGDASTYVADFHRARGEASEKSASAERDREIAAVARNYSQRLRGAELVPPAQWLAKREGFGDYRLQRETADGVTIAELSRNFALHEDIAAADTSLDAPVRRAPVLAHDKHDAIRLLIALLALALVGLLWRAVQTLLVGLFGFGVALEAVEQPDVDAPWQWAKARPQTLVVGAPAELQREIRRDHGPERVRVLDMVSETEAEIPRTPIEQIGPAMNVVIESLELIQRDPVRRIRALRYLELLVTRQRQLHGTKIAVLTDLSPLERLLQRYERDAELLEGSQNPDERRQYDDLKRNREDVRWSRLFASFATYSHRRTTPRVPGDAGARLVQEHSRTAAGATPRPAIAQRVLEELWPLPAHVVRSALPYEARDIKTLMGIAALDIDALSPRAVDDHFASVFIEYYQLIWAASSHAERLILYHLAHGRLVSIARAYAVRTLVRRGVVVLDPVPRLFNRSFAQFVRNVEKPETLKRWRADAPAGGWRLAQLPVLLLIPAGLAVLVMLIKHSGQSAVALVPVLVTAAPVLLQALGVLRRPGSA